MHQDVDAAFITGSYGKQESKPYSDIDLVVIFKENKNDLYSLYQWIEGIFADIFFFDLSDLRRIESLDAVDWNSMDGSLVSWIQKADIQFDHSGTLSTLKKKIASVELKGVTVQDKQSAWQKINYNYVANKRYYDSGDALYHEALELRLLYSVIELICSYVALRDVPWRGEKNAVLYLKETAKDFYGAFQQYTKSASLKDRFELYSKMVLMTFTDDFKQWSQDDQILIKKDKSIVGTDDAAMKYTEALF
jgi:hypothetical protein